MEKETKPRFTTSIKPRPILKPKPKTEPEPLTDFVPDFSNWFF